MSQNLQTFQIPAPDQFEVGTQPVAEPLSRETVDQQFGEIIAYNYPVETPVSSPAAAETTATPRFEIAELCTDILHIGDWLEYERAQKLPGSTGYDLAPVAILRRLLSPTPNRERLLQREAMLGGQVLGAGNSTGNREFLYLGRDSRQVAEWVWHEYNGNQPNPLTTRYEIHSAGITKIQDGQHYRQLEGAEAQNLHAAVSAYWQFVKSELYS